MENQNNKGSERERLQDQVRLRQNKLAQIRALGVDPFGGRFERSHQAAAVADAGPLLESEKTKVRMAGRLVHIRDHGSTTFGVLRDQTGEIQIDFSQDEVSETAWKLLKLLDAGDSIGILGTVHTAHTGEVTVQVQSVELLAKALRPFPEVWNGLSSGEAAYGKRYADFLAHPEKRDDFQKRALMLGAVRKRLGDADFLEVETPMLRTFHGDADTRPFETHLHALDLSLYLRTAPEFDLKRLVIGGFERVFELGRNFQNQGMDSRHSPELTSLTAYQAYGDMEDVIDQVRDICAACAKAVHGRLQFLHQGVVLDLSPSAWTRMTMAEAVKKYTGADFDKARNLEEARRLADNLKAAYDKHDTFGRILARCFDAFVKNKLVQPTIITHYPVEVSPLARKCSEAPMFTDRFEAYIYGMELARGFSELNDPMGQRQRFEMRAEEQGCGDMSAMQVDEDFLRALEYGLPPTAGLAVHIDRLAMILLGKTDVRDVLLFPLVEMVEKDS